MRHRLIAFMAVVSTCSSCAAPAAPAIATGTATVTADIVVGVGASAAAAKVVHSAASESAQRSAEAMRRARGRTHCEPLLQECSRRVFNTSDPIVRKTRSDTCNLCYAKCMREGRWPWLSTISETRTTCHFRLWSDSQ